jgi:hypothetical protein
MAVVVRVGLVVVFKSNVFGRVAHRLGILRGGHEHKFAVRLEAGRGPR